MEKNPIGVPFFFFYYCSIKTLAAEQNISPQFYSRKITKKNINVKGHLIDLENINSEVPTVVFFVSLSVR